MEADATGGSQGFAQLVCMVGDFSDHLPTEAAQQSLVATLAWLAERSAVDTSPGATTSFVSAWFRPAIRQVSRSRRPRSPGTAT